MTLTIKDLDLLIHIPRALVRGWRCLHCGHTWMGRKVAPYQTPAIRGAQKRPKKCPQCRTPNWYKPRVRRRPDRGIGWPDPELQPPPEPEGGI